MKSYTDIEQSVNLAEILPLESADMLYVYDRHLNKLYGDTPYVASYKVLNENVDIPCWSLAALLSVIKPVNSNTYTLTGTLDGGATIEFDEVTNVMYQREEIIDAVYEMVIWLHEKGVL